MKLKIKITYRDDQVEEYICADFPSLGSDWITLYLENLKRLIIAAPLVHHIEEEI